MHQEEVVIHPTFSPTQNSSFANLYALLGIYVTPQNPNFGFRILF